MAQSTGIILAAGGVTLLNEVALTPVASGGKISANFNWRVIPATAALALAFVGLEKLAPKFAVGLAGLILLGAFLLPDAQGTDAIENFSKIMGYKK